MEKKATDPLETTVFHRFADVSILRKALTHRSNIVAAANGDDNNQRLEFLGDRVLGLIVAHMLYEVFPKEEEGALARRFAGLVSRGALVTVARDIDLGKYLSLAGNGDSTGLREQESTLEDACEALVGALYLDGGLEAAQRFVQHYWQKLLKELPEPPKDAKTALQEWAQSRGLPLPSYREAERVGPAHAPSFVIEVSVGEGHSATAQGTTKKAAEQKAAATLLENLSAGQA